MNKLKKWHKRLIILVINLTLIGGGFILALNTFNENIIFFVTPTDLIDDHAKYNGKKIRLGGLVKTGSIKKGIDTRIEFIITDLTNEIKVTYQGLIPALFKEDSGTVVYGIIDGEIFLAEELLAKHDERYIPKDVADQLKKSGQWKELTSIE